MWAKGIAVVAALVLVGCPGPTFVVQQYAGEMRPRETIATLRINGSDPVKLLTLDGEDLRSPLESDSRLHIELLPGRHWLSVGNAGAPNDPIEPAAFDAEAGKVYRATVVAGAAHVIEVERGSDAPGRDVTATPAKAKAAVTPEAAPVLPPP